HMKPWILVLTALFAVALIATDADARRFGGARSIGKQRQSIGQQQAAPKAPAQAPQQAAPSTPPPQQPSPASRWLGPLAGLALGAGLAALFLHNGFAGALAGILLLAAIVAGIAFLVRMFRGRTAARSPLRYAGPDIERVEPRVARMDLPAGGDAPAPHSVAATTAVSSTPAGFDAAEFTRHAKMNFVRLQAANDARDFETIRDVVTPELYQEIETELRARGDTPQKTDVVTLNAEVLDVATEGDQYVVSTRFSGVIREQQDEPPQPFSEIWHLEKPVRGGSGWLIAGIQQA
ncbi:MAG TPA: Tim44-like domain-containing protein, partial [Burkholderiales bacterium]|nr:Tim44-like domain-containing protein [Burkholderiales bacterium]